jgi:hypothetical protein
MANLLITGKIKLQYNEVIARAVQFFANEKWRCQSQSERIATFEGRPPIPWFLILITIVSFFFFIIPGIVMYIVVFRKMYKFQNLVVTAKPIDNGCHIDINYPAHSKKYVKRFMESLPAIEEEDAIAIGNAQPVEA